MQFKKLIFLSFLMPTFCTSMERAPSTYLMGIALEKSAPSLSLTDYRDRNSNATRSSPGFHFDCYNNRSSLSHSHSRIAPTLTSEIKMSVEDKFFASVAHVKELQATLNKTYYQEIAALSLAEKVTKHVTLNHELQHLKQAFSAELNTCTAAVQKAIANGGIDPLQIKPSATLTIAEQIRFVDKMKQLSAMLVAIDAKKEFIRDCLARIEKEIISQLKPIVATTSTQELIQKELPILKQEVAWLDQKLIKAKDFELDKYQKQLLIAETKIKYIESVIKDRIEKQYIEQRLQDFKQLQKDLIAQQIDDKKLIEALNKTIDEKAIKSTIFNALQVPVEKILHELNIPVEDFKKMYGDHFQQCLFEKTNSILYETAMRNTEFGGNAQIKPYIDATAHMCYLTVKNIQGGTPHEAIASYTLAQALSKATDVAIGLSKGLVIGSIEGVKGSIDIIMHPTAIASGLKQACILFVNLCNRDPQTLAAISHAMNEFCNLPAEKQAEQIGSLFAIMMTPGPGKILSSISEISAVNKALQSVTKLAKAELAGLKTLYQIEKTNLINIKGVAVHEKYSKRIYELIASKALKTQEDIFRYCERLDAPFLNNCREVIQEVARETKSSIEAIIKSANAIKITEPMIQGILESSKELKILESCIEKINSVIKDHRFGSFERRINNVSKIFAKDIETAKFYEKISQMTEDITSIAKNTGIPKEIIQKIKNHLFVESHILRDGIRKFHPDNDIADAWLRLIDNSFVRSDLRLLKHEFAESLIMQGTKISYDSVHYTLNKVNNMSYNWQDFI